MLFVKEIVEPEEIKEVQRYISEYETQNEAENEEETSVSQYINSLVSDCYQKSIEDIANTKVGNKLTRRRNLTQIMRESFFYGANRFGNNFIA